MIDKRKGLAAFELAARSVALPGAPLRPVADQQERIEQTNPRTAQLPPIERLSPMDRMILSEVMWKPHPPRSTADARSKTLRSAPGRPVAHQQTRAEQTNPTSTSPVQE